MTGTSTIPRRVAAVLAAMDNSDTHMLTAAHREAHALKALARDKGLDLEGDQIIAPALLNPHAARLVDIFNPLSFSAEYRHRQEHCDRHFVNELCTSPYFRDMTARWPERDDETLIGCLQWFSDRQQFHFGRDGFPIRGVRVTTYQEPCAPGPQGRLTLGWHHAGRHADRPATLAFNTHPDTKFNDFFRAMTVLYHENRHAAQWAMGNSWQEQDIDRRHFLAREASLFLLYFLDRTSYILGITPVYRAYPLEQDAYDGTARFMEILRDRMARDNIRPAIS